MAEVESNRSDTAKVDDGGVEPKSNRSDTPKVDDGGSASEGLEETTEKVCDGNGEMGHSGGTEVHDGKMDVVETNPELTKEHSPAPALSEKLETAPSTPASTRKRRLRSCTPRSRSPFLSVDKMKRIDDVTPIKNFDSLSKSHTDIGPFVTPTPTGESMEILTPNTVKNCTGALSSTPLELPQGIIADEARRSANDTVCFAFVCVYK